MLPLSVTKRPACFWTRIGVAMRFRYILPSCLLLALAIAFALARVATPRPGPCRIDLQLENLEKLESGMCESEIASILGGPAGDYRTQKGIGYVFAVSGPVVPLPDRHTKSEWLTDQYAIEVWFGEDGKALDIRHGAGCRSPTWSDRLLDQLEKLDPW